MVTYLIKITIILLMILTVPPRIKCNENTTTKSSAEVTVSSNMQNYSIETDQNQVNTTVNISITTVTTSEDEENLSGDFGTEIESDTDPSTVINYSESKNLEKIVTNKSVNGSVRKTTKQQSTEQFSMKDSLKDIAYYLRSYKFNEYDRRYERNGSIAPRIFFKSFPRPPLRSLHWEVHKYCEPSFSGCVEYLRKRIQQVSLKRADDTSVIIQEQRWNFTNHTEQIQLVDDECKKMRKIGDSISEPFEGPLERFQWRVTASYFMCWYTMKEIPELRHLSDHCDNFANCLDEKLGPNNKDLRANDSDPFSCALYSFCPDPCCPSKLLTRFEDCWDSKDNPCSRENPPGQRKCILKRTENVELRDIILNRWNVSCRCPAGYRWNSRYGMCVDVDECYEGEHDCKKEGQGCMNLPGSFRCACKWGNVWSQTKNGCTESEALKHLKLSLKEEKTNTTEAEPLILKIMKFVTRSQADKLYYYNNSLLSFMSLLFLSFLFQSKYYC